MLFDSFFFRCLKVAFFSAEMKAELEKAKKEADAAKKVLFCVCFFPQGFES